LNQTLEIRLRRFVDEQLTTWAKFLLIIEFAYNSAKHLAIERSRFSLVYGKEPESPITLSFGKDGTTVKASASSLK
jgi:hypothetical protein